MKIMSSTRVISFCILLTFLLNGIVCPIVTTENLRELIKKASVACVGTSSSTVTNKCPRNFGSFFECWPESDTGKEITLPCTEYFFREGVGSMKRRCLPSGKWETRANSTSCQRLPLKDFDIKRIELLKKFNINFQYTPCDFNNGGCEEKCTYLVSRNISRCSCEKVGFKLKADLKGCEVATLPEYTGPTNEPIKITNCPNKESGVCKQHGKNRPDGNYGWPANPNCFLQCVDGTPHCQCCPSNLVFSEKCNRCVQSGNTETCTTIAPTTTDHDDDDDDHDDDDDDHDDGDDDHDNPRFRCTMARATTFCNAKEQRKVGQYRDPRNHHRFYQCVAANKEETKFIGYCSRCHGELEWVSVTHNTGYCDYRNK